MSEERIERWAACSRDYSLKYFEAPECAENWIDGSGRYRLVHLVELRDTDAIVDTAELSALREKAKGPRIEAPRPFKVGDRVRIVDAPSHEKHLLGRDVAVTAVSSDARLVARQSEGLCSPKQARILARSGINPADVSFAEAGSLIDFVAKGGWRPLVGFDLAAWREDRVRGGVTEPSRASK